MSVSNQLSPRYLVLRHCHLMTRSARANTFGGIITPICFAVLRLMTISILSTPSTGRSFGFTPL